MLDLKTLSVSRKLRATAGLLIAVFAVVTPGIFTYIQWTSLSSELMSQALVHAQPITDLVNQDPDRWLYQETKLRSFVAKRLHLDEQSLVIRVLDAKGQILAQQGEDLPWPQMVQRSNVYDAGVVVGRVEVAGSLRPVMLKFLIAATLSLLVNGVLYWLVVVQLGGKLEETILRLREAKERAESANRAKSAFLGSMSHELRTPLNAILGYSQLFCMNPDLSPDIRSNALEIQDAGQHLLALVNNLLDLSAIESGNLKLAIETLPVKSLTADCFRQLAPFANKAGVALIDAGGSGQGVAIQADPLRLRQVVLNFLSNGIKYARTPGTVSLSYALHGSAVRIAVSDTGMGIAADKQARVFNAFDRLGKEGSTIEGTGIGLTISKRMVEAMGGSIGFDSIEGQGSTFWVEFPVAAP